MRYRITKYNPVHRDTQGAYQREEWTSCYDIGLMIGKKKLCAEEYLAVESAYVEAIRIVAQVNGCTRFRACQLERLFSVWDVKRKMKRLGLPFSDQDADAFRAVNIQDSFDEEMLSVLSRLILRELLWATLYHTDDRVSFTFGYDYYLYVDCPPLPDDVIGQIEKNGLFVEVLGDENQE